jgi:hypothetical protein
MVGNLISSYGRKLPLSTFLLSTLRYSEKEPQIYRKTDHVIHFMNLTHTISVPNITTLILPLSRFIRLKWIICLLRSLLRYFTWTYSIFRLKYILITYISETECVSVFK